MNSAKPEETMHGPLDRRRAPSRPEYFKALEGIRGYAFLAVFFTHYNLVLERPASLWKSPLYLAVNFDWFLVPIFFVLSGFLITRILLATKEREGYFRVFYLRRAIRVLPLYYIAVGVITVAAVLWHYQLGYKHILYLLYLQNFTDVRIGPMVDVSHLWSLAIEEQFYLLWPLAVWKCRDEKSLMKFSYVLVAACALFRFSWPLWHLSAWHAYTFTPTRVDGILLGCALAVHYKQTQHWERYVRFAKISLPLLFASLVAVMMVKGTTLPQYSYIGNVFCTPAMNMIGYALVILALTPGTLVERVCSGRRICAFGQLTYGLYLLHQLYSPLFCFKLTPMLAQHMPQAMAQLSTSLIALAFTTGLAWLANRYIELPMMKLKDRWKYGPVVKSSERAPLFAWVRHAFRRAEPEAEDAPQTATGASVLTNALAE